MGCTRVVLTDLLEELHLLLRVMRPRIHHVFEHLSRMVVMMAVVMLVER